MADEKSIAPAKHAGGRPSLYKPEYCQMLVDEMAKGYSIGAFAGTIGVSRDTIVEWMRVHPEFSLAVSEGKSARLKQWETAALRKSFTNEGGNPTLIIFGLKNAGMDDWVDITEQRHTGSVELTAKQVSALPDDRLADIIGLLEQGGTSSDSPSGEGEAEVRD